MNRQRGQSMTEYLVVLGITGAGLLAATTDVTTLFNNVQDSYRTQSSEMNKVQIYGNPKFQTSTVDRDDSDGDDGDDTPEVPVNNPERVYPPVVLGVYDAAGNYLGTVNENDILVDKNGNELAWCKRIAEGPKIGQCVFVDEKGNEVFPGASVSTEWVDDQGNPLPLHALSRSGTVVGFAYFYNNNYYDAVSRKRLDPQPTNLTGIATRKVTSLDANGKAFTSGYEANGYIYSESSVQSSSTDFSTAKAIEGELVTIEFVDTQLPVSDPKKYRPCVVGKTNWSVNMTSGMLNIFGSGDKLFLSPSSYIDTTSSNCNGRKTVRRLANGNWEIR